MKEIIADTLLDSIKILPFLFLTYLAKEYIEHRTSDRVANIIRKSGKLGPLLGSVLGAFPQCGFSAAAANLYAGRIITRGTLIAIFLSTSDEMLPILISEQVAAGVIIKIVCLKVVIGMIAGFIIDLLIGGNRERKQSRMPEQRPDHLCEHEHCNCGGSSILMPAVNHTVKIFFFVLIISFFMNGLITLIGEETLAGFIQNKPVLGPLLAGVIGLIPNCAASVVITQLYLEGLLGLGAMLSGLLVGAGIGLLVLFKAHDDVKENIKLLILLYLIGVVSGIIIEFSGLVI